MYRQTGHVRDDIKQLSKALKSSRKLSGQAEGINGVTSAAEKEKKAREFENEVRELRDRGVALA